MVLTKCRLGTRSSGIARAQINADQVPIFGETRGGPSRPSCVVDSTLPSWIIARSLNLPVTLPISCAAEPATTKYHCSRFSRHVLLSLPETTQSKHPIKTPNHLPPFSPPQLRRYFCFCQGGPRRHRHRHRHRPPTARQVLRAHTPLPQKKTPPPEHPSGSFPVPYRAAPPHPDQPRARNPCSRGAL